MTDCSTKSIMLENKDYNKNVPKKEIDKFKRDLINNSDVWAGIMMSNAVPIKGLSNWYWEGKITIYLHFTNKDPNKIKNAYDIISTIKDVDIDFQIKKSWKSCQKILLNLNVKLINQRKIWRNFTKQCSVIFLILKI